MKNQKMYEKFIFFINSFPKNCLTIKIKNIIKRYEVFKWIYTIFKFKYQFYLHDENYNFLYIILIKIVK